VLDSYINASSGEHPNEFTRSSRWFDRNGHWSRGGRNKSTPFNSPYRWCVSELLGPARNDA
jgi:hypothetical protein